VYLLFNFRAAIEVIIGVVCVMTSSGADQLLLTQDGQPRATIVVADEPRPRLWVGGMFESQPLYPQQYAAEELQRRLLKISGAELPIVPAASAPQDGTLILVGRSTLSDHYGIQPPTQPEAFLIKSFARGLAIIGEIAPVGTNNWEQPVDRGSLFAVCAFLERYLDYQSYVRDESIPEDLGLVVPHKATIAIDTPLEFADAPFYSFRSGGGPHPYARKGNRYIFRCVHTHQNWAQRYQQTHPEYFVLKGDGTRNFKYLCYSEPGVLQRELEHIEEFYASGKWGFGWPKPNEHYIAVEPDDHFPGCQCERCQAWGLVSNLWFGNEAWGSASNLWFDYVRRLALEVKKRWPDKRVACLAYQSHRYCPDFDLPDNVDVMVCMELSTALGKEPEVYQHNIRLLREWSAQVDNDPTRLYTFEYHCWPSQWTHAPIIYPHYLQRCLREAREYISGSYVCGGGNTAQEAHFMYRVWSRLLWNPDFDLDAYLTEYCQKFFGPAAEAMEEFYQLLINRYEQTIWPEHIADVYVSPALLYGQTYPPEVVRQLEQYLVKAQAAVGALPTRSVEFEGEGWMLRRNAGDQAQTYRIVLTTLGEQPLVNPTLVWDDHKLRYRGQLAKGLKLVIDAGPKATLSSVEPAAGQAGTDVTDHIEGDLPILPGNSAEVFHFYCDQPTSGASVRLTMSSSTDTDQPDQGDVYQRRVLWMRQGFEDLHPSNAIWQGHDGFFVAARVAHKWLDREVPTYPVAQVSRRPRPDFNDPAWQQAEATYLVRGKINPGVPFDNLGFPADVPTRVQMLQDPQNVYVAFHCTQPEELGDNDSVGLTLFDAGNPVISVTCRPDGHVETEAEGIHTYTTAGDGWWGALLTIPKRAISTDGELGTYRADLLRTRAGKSYIWSPGFRMAPWAPFPMSRRGQVIFAGN